MRPEFSSSEQTARIPEPSSCHGYDGDSQTPDCGDSRRRPGGDAFAGSQQRVVQIDGDQLNAFKTDSIHATTKLPRVGGPHGAAYILAAVGGGSMAAVAESWS